MRLLPLLLITACSASALPWSNAKETTAETFFKPSPISKLAVLLDSTTQVDANIRFLYGKTSCTSGPNPVWFGTTSLPREGLWFRFPWRIEAVDVPPPARHSVAMLASFRPLSADVDLTSNGFPSCMLLVQPDYILRASQNENDIFTYNPATGKGVVQFIPVVGMRGLKVYMQLIVADARGVTRFSAGVELTIGT